jgi:hypothetical protein
MSSFRAKERFAVGRQPAFLKDAAAQGEQFFPDLKQLFRWFSHSRLYHSGL